MSRFNAHPAGETLAVLHRAGGSWRLLVASTAGRTPSILESVELPADSTEGLAARIHARKVDRVIGVVPASGVVCRTCALPQADREQLQEVLELQAEGQFLGHTPAHRIGMAVLPEAPGETSRSGIVVSWPESATAAAPPLDTLLGAPGESGRRSYCPDVAGLAALLNGVRPPDPLIWLDRAGGSVALAITHANGAVFRCLREEVGPGDRWQERLARALAETAISVGHSGAFVDSLVDDVRARSGGIGAQDAALFVPAEILASASERFDGAPDDPAWWSTYGIAAGVVLAAIGDLAPLTALKNAPVVRRPSRWRSFAETISRPRAAIMTAVVCLVVLGLAPPAMSGLRLGVLKLRYPDVKEQATTVERAREQIAMYGALQREAWSMTKLLSDVVSNTPEGIDLVSIRLQHSDSTFAVSGLARPNGGLSAPDVVARMQENLRDSRLFREVRLNWGTPNRLKELDFELSAKIVAPHRATDYAIALDFEKWPLGPRKRGEGPPDEDRPTPPPANPVAGAGADPVTDPVTDPGDTPARVSERPNGSAPPDEAVAALAPDEGDRPREPGGSATTRRPRSGGIGGGAPSGTANPANVDERSGDLGPGLGNAPEPMTVEQIAVMTESELQNRLTVIAEARGRARRAKDEELETRLKTEFEAIFVRLKELK